MLLPQNEQFASFVVNMRLTICIHGTGKVVRVTAWSSWGKLKIAFRFLVFTTLIIDKYVIYRDRYNELP